jgi:hypothetical protein
MKALIEAGESKAVGFRAGVSLHPCSDQGRSLPPPGPPASLSLLPERQYNASE